MANEQNNPLFKHFRQPAIYLKLPSGGKYWPPGSLDLPESGEIPVYPMTVKDEITLRTPDALLNGEGTVEVFKSCCPNIKNGWQIPVCDLDAVLIAIRLSSYGEELEISSKCEKCDETNEHVIDLRSLLDNMREPRFDDLEINGLTVKLKPQKFQTVNNNNIVSFEQQRLVSSILDSDLSEEEKTKQFNQIFPKISELTVSTIVDSIEYILVDDQKVQNTQHITEFLNNCDRQTYEKIKNKVEELATFNKIQPFDVECTSCEAKYKTTLTLEFSNFFG